MYDAVVVGAGPAGGMAARALAAAGFRTAILEKKKVVGEPVQCAEGVSEFGLASNGLRPRDEWVAQRVSGAKCIVPNGTWFYITRLPGYAINRPMFDRSLVDGAVDDGAELHTSTKVTGMTRNDVDRKTQTIAGSIPSRYDLTALAAPGLAIAGDAAGITNPLNGAGIHPGIFSGRIAGEFAVAALEREDPTSMMAYDRAMKASPFLDPLLFWMIDRIRRWGDRLMNSVGEELDGLDWRAVNPRMILSVLLRKPWLGIHAREFYRMILALELCDPYGW